MNISLLDFAFFSAMRHGNSEFEDFERHTENSACPSVKMQMQQVNEVCG